MEGPLGEEVDPDPSPTTPICDPYCIFCGSVILPGRKSIVDDPAFPEVWRFLCQEMKVPHPTQRSMYSRLIEGQGTFCSKNCSRILDSISKLITQISSLETKLKEKSVELRNLVIAASTLDKVNVGQTTPPEVNDPTLPDKDAPENLVYNFRLLISQREFPTFLIPR